MFKIPSLRFTVIHNHQSINNFTALTLNPNTPISPSIPHSTTQFTTMTGSVHDLRDEFEGGSPYSWESDDLEDTVNSVDQFLLEALHNPRERLSVLRIEQEVEKFMRDPSQLQMEFQQLPTSYLRTVAHRVARHYFLQSTDLLDRNLSEGSGFGFGFGFGFGSRVIISKTIECRLPLIRLADIPIRLPTDESTNNVGVPATTYFSSFHEAGSSRTSSPRVSKHDTSARLDRKMRKSLELMEWLVQQQQWTMYAIKALANALNVPLAPMPPPLPLQYSDSDSDE